MYIIKFKDHLSQEQIDKAIETININEYAFKIHKDKNKFDLIRKWAKEKGILDKGDPKTQYIKLCEECGELAQSILKNNDADFIDAIGDCVVVLTNLAALKGLKIEDCITSAYNIISQRKGKMENGTFIKD